MPASARFGELLRKIRSVRYPKQKTFAAELLFGDAAYLSRIEKGKQSPSEEFVIQCLRLLVGSPGLSTRDEVLAFVEAARPSALWLESLPEEVKKLLPPHQRYVLPPAWRPMSSAARLPRAEVLKDLLLAVRQWRGPGNPIVIWAPPSSGKRTLIDLLLEAPELKQWFPDGVLTAWLGQASTPEDWQRAWAQAARLPLETASLSDRASATAQLKAHLATHRTLLVVADVQTVAEVEALCVGGVDSTLLITTASLEVVNALTRTSTRGLRFEVPPLTTEESLQLQAQLGHTRLTMAEVTWLNTYLQGHPLALTGALVLSQHWTGAELRRALCDTPPTNVPPDLEINLFRVWRAAHQQLSAKARRSLEQLVYLPQVTQYGEDEFQLLWELPYAASVRFIMEELRAYHFIEGHGAEIRLPAATWLFVRYLAVVRGMKVTDADRWRMFGQCYLQTAEWRDWQVRLKKEVEATTPQLWWQRFCQRIRQLGLTRQEVLKRLLRAMADDLLHRPEPPSAVLPARVAYWCLVQEHQRFRRRNSAWVLCLLVVWFVLGSVMQIAPHLPPNEWTLLLLLTSILVGGFVWVSCPVLWWRQRQELQHILWASVTFEFVAEPEPR